MFDYRVVALPEAAAEEARTRRRSPGYGHPVHEEVATGPGPCRVCLRTFEVGAEKRLLLTWDPFLGLDPFPLPGPVFIHAEGCRRYPEDAGFPPELAGREIALQAYGRGRRLRARVHVEDGRVDAPLRELLSREDVDYVHVRDLRAGCFTFTIDRGAAGAPVSTVAEEQA